MFSSYEKIRLAPSRVEFANEPDAFDGYIECKRKRHVDMTINDKTYTVNAHGVVCCRSIREIDGKERAWYSFCSSADELFHSLSEDKRFAESLSKDKDHIGFIFK